METPDGNERDSQPMTPPAQSLQPNSTNSSIRLTALFLILGAGVFALHAWLGDDPSETILVSKADQSRLEQLWQTQALRPATRAELEALIADHVREEILVREARRLGLEVDDVIIRRRLAQKMSFLLEDTETRESRTEAELERYFEANRDDYREPRRTSFQHVFFAIEPRDGETSGRDRAQQALVQLQEDARDWRALGDPFMLNREYAARTDTEIDGLFGAGFAQRLASLPVGSWQPPIPSALGLHDVRVVAREEQEAPEFASVRGEVAQRFMANRQSEANARAYARVAEKYNVVIESLGDGRGEDAAKSGAERNMEGDAEPTVGATGARSSRTRTP